MFSPACRVVNVYINPGRRTAPTPLNKQSRTRTVVRAQTSPLKRIVGCTSLDSLLQRQTFQQAGQRVSSKASGPFWAFWSFALICRVTQEVTEHQRASRRHSFPEQDITSDWRNDAPYYAVMFHDHLRLVLALMMHKTLFTGSSFIRLAPQTSDKESTDI